MPERGQKVNVENSEISLRYQIRAFRQFQICRRAGGVRLPRVSWQDSRREEPEVVRPMGSELRRNSTNERRAGPIANLAPNCISEMYQLKTCFDNSRKWSGARIVWYLKHLTVSTKKKQSGDGDDECLKDFLLQTVFSAVFVPNSHMCQGLKGGP